MKSLKDHFKSIWEQENKDSAKLILFYNKIKRVFKMPNLATVQPDLGYARTFSKLSMEDTKTFHVNNVNANGAI